MAGEGAPAPSLTVACVCVGPAYSDDYVLILRDMVQRYLNIPHRFVCLSDREIPSVECMPVEHRGWWTKIELFRPGRFEGRVLYLDLDVAVVGPLDDLVARPGIIRDWHLPTFNSSVMCWDAGTLDHVYSLWVPDVALRLHGDQDWITEMAADWSTFPAAWCVSYRSHARDRVPTDARVVCFHGRPKPHEIVSGWVPKVWKIGGDFVPVMSKAANMELAEFYANMRANVQRPLPWLEVEGQPERKGTLHIVGGGPTLDNAALRKLRALNRDKHAILAVNGAIAWLKAKGIVADFGAIMDGREFNRRFAQGVSRETHMLIASICHPGVLDDLAGHEVTLWHPDMGDPEKQGDRICDAARPNAPADQIGGYSSIGLRSVPLGIVLGFRKFELWGMPSSLIVNGKSTLAEDDPDALAIWQEPNGEREHGQHHAYAQPENDGRHVRLINVPGLGDRLYPVHGWMMRQADEFGLLFFECARAGIEIRAHGPGLLPDLCRDYRKRWSRMNERADLVSAA